MLDTTGYEIARRWPATHPERLQLYSFPTPNGVKVSIALEELGLPYEAHKVGLSDSDVKSPEFLSLNPNGKIPAIVDPDGPDGQPVALFESGAILIYLTDKTGALIPRDPAGRYETISWVMFQMAGIGPMFGQIGYFHKFAGKEIEDKRPLQRFVTEARRLLEVLETRLGDGRRWVMGEQYTIADIAAFPWVRSLLEFYDAGEMVGIQDFPQVQAWLARAVTRPASQRGLNIPDRNA